MPDQDGMTDRIAPLQDAFALSRMSDQAQIGDDTVDEKDVVGGDFHATDPDDKVAGVVAGDKHSFARPGRV